ncbi:hypothetical protein [Marinibactrum halimedae]|uniref:DUF4124 domain-containing protein n=1 Tax=Marinibactrum halimedae TaxID=1444977 RepID=A0AA37TDL1_9GAMM|nr:hypothetical protein [Marinibactrum halimedae]MCD9458225.1 hypothetical protein [Marinibactrum halimedae]GLS27147.1 hypothetical protein GCM10007877_28660 [Marinibactrum halimedae]
MVALPANKFTLQVEVVLNSLRRFWGVYVLFMVIVGQFGAASATWAQSGVMYRYTNNEGVKVINHTVPPEYVQNGYEVINSHGDVIRVIEPSLTDEQLELKAEQAKLDEWDRDLMRRYSTVSDVEAAKARRLKEIDTSVAILKGNIRGFDAQIAREQSKAADFERRGRQVPEAVLINIKNFNEEKSAAERLIEARKEDYQRVEAQYDKDIERFRLIVERRNSVSVSAGNGR